MEMSGGGGAVGGGLLCHAEADMENVFAEFPALLSHGELPETTQTPQRHPKVHDRYCRLGLIRQ